MSKDFSITQALSFGFSTTFKNIFLLLSLQFLKAFFWVTGLIVFFILVYGFIPMYIVLTQTFFSYDQTMVYSLWNCFDLTRFVPMVGVSIFLAFIDTLFTLGLLKVSLALYDNGRSSWSEFFSAWPLLISALVVNILYKLIIGVGFALLIIPGIIWALQFSFSYLSLVDSGGGPLKALRLSSQVTRGVKMKLLWFWLLILLINSVGYLFFGIGLLVTIPATVLAQIFVYRHLQSARRR